MALCKKCGGVMLTERPGNHQCPVSRERLCHRRVLLQYALDECDTAIAAWDAIDDQRINDELGPEAEAAAVQGDDGS